MDGGRSAPDILAVLIIATLAPVFLLIALGLVLQRSGFVSAGFLREANRVTYYLGLPALLFSQLATSVHHGDGARSMLGAMFVGTLLTVGVAYLFGWMLRVPGVAMGTFVQGGFRGNLAFVGLPILYALPDTPFAGGLSARTAALVVVAPMMVLYNIGGVIVLLLSQHRLGFAMLSPFLRQLATTPPLLATLAGLLFAAMGWPLPAAIDKAFTSLGEMALPLGLLGVGGSLASANFSGAWRAPLVSALVKTFVSPLVGWGVGRWLGLGAAELRMIVIFMACPTAVVSYTMALELKGDEPIASGTIVLSVITSLVSLALIVGTF